MRILLIVLSLSAGLLSSLPGAGSKSLERTGDVLQIALPVGAGLGTLVLRDWAGLGQFAAVMVISQGATHLLKYAFETRRPDGGKNGFPSAHTSAAFAGSGFAAFRYGGQYTWPLQILAGVVGYSRLTAEKHSLADVLGGAALSLFSAWRLVRRRDPGKGARKATTA